MKDIASFAEGAAPVPERLLKARRSPPSFMLLVLLTALSTLSLNMFLPSLPGLAVAFDADYAVVGLAVAGYLGMTGLLQLVLGPVSDRYGRRPVLLTSLAVFTLASVGCILAPTIEVFLVFRLMQGMVVSGYLLSQAMVRDTLPPEEAARRLGYLATAMAVAPMVGPMIGGILDSAFGWQASFVVFVLGGAILLAVCWSRLAETNTQRSDTLRDQLRKYPVLLKSRVFWGYALCMAWSVATFFTFLVGAPLVAENTFGMSGTALGIALGSITCGFGIGSLFSARMSTRLGLTGIMVAGRVIACLGPAIGGALLLAGVLTPLSFFGSTILVGLGNGLTMPGAAAGAMSVQPKLAGSAAGLSGALVLAGGSLVTTFTGVVVPESAPVGHLLLIMEVTALASLVAALWVRHASR